MEETLSEDFIGLMRLAVAEARRLPDMVGPGAPVPRARRPLVVRLLVEGVGESFWSDANDPRAIKAGRFFAESVLLPFLLRALARARIWRRCAQEIAPHVRERARFFLAALRNGGLGEPIA